MAFGFPAAAPVIAAPTVRVANNDHSGFRDRYLEDLRMAK